MSFLYQALIKEQNKKQQEGSSTANSGSIEQQQTTTFTHSTAPVQGMQQPSYGLGTMVAPEETNKNHWFWLAIAALLMVVGLLGGYLFGSKDTNQVMYSSIQQQASQVQQKQQELEQNLAQLKESANTQAVTQVEQKPVEAPVSKPEKQIEVALGDDGKVKTQVTNIGEEAPNVPEEQLVKRHILPEVAIEDIPDTLKSTFADAVKATEQKGQPELFEAQVTTGSSLPLIEEMKLSEIYWVPDIAYEMHIYASEPSERWIRINGKTLSEGEQLIDNLTLIEIRQDQIIWQGNDRRFAQNALQDFVKQ